MSDLVAMAPSRSSPGILLRGPGTRRAAAVLLAMFATIIIWIDRHRQRRALADLAEHDEHLLADIGRTREDARREAARPFWASGIGIFLTLGTPPKPMWTSRCHDAH